MEKNIWGLNSNRKIFKQTLISRKSGVKEGPFKWGHPTFHNSKQNSKLFTCLKNIRY